jgi:quercetin dioxygenase-like cupin family protein
MVMKRAILATAAAILAMVSIPARADGTVKLQETVTPVFEHELPNVPGRSLIAVEVQYPPGAASPSHTHAKSAFSYAYVLSGEIVSAVDDEKPRVYRAGESWYETPGAHHRVSRNASETEPAKLLAIFVLNPGERQVTVPDPE